MVQILTKRCMFLLMDAVARTRQRLVGCGDDESRVVGAYGRDELNRNGKLSYRPLPIAS